MLISRIHALQLKTEFTFNVHISAVVVGGGSTTHSQLQCIPFYLFIYIFIFFIGPLHGLGCIMPLHKPGRSF